ncbi:MAG: hypothetical protein AABZ61_02305, partial [Bacteroidota bacterium]
NRPLIFRRSCSAPAIKHINVFRLDYLEPLANRFRHYVLLDLDSIQGVQEAVGTERLTITFFIIDFTAE